MLFDFSPKSVAAKVWQRVFRTRPEDTLPHVVTHQRVYILPTKRGLAFALTLLLMLVASVNYSLSLGYALCFILTGLFAATLLHTYRNIAGVEVDEIVATNAFSGDNVTFLVSLVNRLSESRHGICVSERNGVKLFTGIAPKDSTQAMLIMPVSQRGRISLGRITIYSDWPLGLWKCWSYLHVPASGLVYPKPEAAPPPLPANPDGEGEQNAVSSHEGEVSGVRNYRPGDSLGSIAWKSAAKGAGLQVRTFDAGMPPPKLTLTLNSTGLHEPEEQLSRLCAWVVQANATQTEYSLDLPGESFKTNRADPQQQTALEILALYGKEA